MAAAPPVEAPPVAPAPSSWMSNPFASKTEEEPKLGPDGQPLPPSWKFWGGKRRPRRQRGGFSPFAAHSIASSASSLTGGRRRRRTRTHRRKSRTHRRKSRKHRR